MGILQHGECNNRTQGNGLITFRQNIISATDHDGIFLALIRFGHYISWKGKTIGFTMTDIDKVLKQYVAKQLDPATIVDLYSKKDEDADGDPFLEINVVYRAKNNLLDPEKVLGLARSLRQPLSKMDTDRYPVFTFIPEEEADIATT